MSLHACLIRRLAERAPAPDNIRHQLQFGNARRWVPRRCDEGRRKSAASRAHRGKRRGAPASAFASAVRCCDGDGVLPDGRHSRKGRHRLSDPQPLLSDHTRPAGRSLASSHRPRGSRAAAPMPAFQLIWLYGPAGTIPTIPIRRVFEAEASGLPADLSRSHRVRRRLRCVRPIRLRSFQGAAAHGGSRMSWGASSSPQRPFSIWSMGSGCFPCHCPLKPASSSASPLPHYSRRNSSAAGARSAASWRSRPPMAQQRSPCLCLRDFGCRSRSR